MSHISKPLDWEIFNIPPKQPVQYYSILKKKREFSQLIRQYDSQVLKHGYLHYCGIVPKSISSSLNNRYEILIVFFDEVPNTSYIGFRVNVSKETFIQESNSLLLFLKKSKKAVFYLMNNNCIHVQCGTNAWELFYLLYDKYLRQYVLTVIGTQFFYHFVYSYCIQKEIQLLEILYKRSKIIRVSKKSIYYKIHRKRKISVTDLIHMTLNMPKSKKHVISCFNSKESLLCSDFKDGNFYTSVGNKINVSKLALKKFKKQFQNPLHGALSNPVALMNVFASAPDSVDFHSESLVSKCKAYSLNNELQQVSSNNTAVKRKFEEVENYEQPDSSTSKILKISASSSTKDINEHQWEQYTNLKAYAIKSYSGIPCINYLVPNLLQNGKSSHAIVSNSYLLKNHCSVSVQSEIVPSSSVEEIDSKGGSVTVEEAREVADCINLYSTNEGNSKLISVPNNAECGISKMITFNQQICVGENNESLPCQDISCLDGNTKSSASTSKNVHQNNFSSSEHVSFTTAAGKTINISNTAMLTAHRFIQDVFNDGKQLESSEKVYSDTSITKIDKKLPAFKYNKPDFTKKTVTGGMPLAKTSLKPSCGIRCFREDEMTSENTDAVLPENIKCFNLDSFDSLEDVSFSTAAGKTINVSNTAIQAAHKLIQGVFEREKEPAPAAASNYGTYKNKVHRSASYFKDISCPSKKSISEEMDIEMDKTLVEKIFEDTLFDEKELETIPECNRNKNSDVIIEAKSDKNLQTHKPKKSLGGRRSMRFCSHKLQ